MAVPKKRTGHSAQGKRRSNWKATKPALTTCPNCGQPVLAHTVCTACGTYKGKPVRLKDQAAADAKEVKETKKAAKKISGQVFVSGYMVSFLLSKQRSGMTRSHSRYVKIFKTLANCFPKWLYHFTYSALQENSYE